jgi:hypothetical protein
MTIEAYAQKNVQADFNESDPTKDSYIKNKKKTQILVANASIGDIGGNDSKIITFPSTLPNANYNVQATLISNSTNWDDDNDVSFVIFNKTASGFSVALREYSANVQNLSIDYSITMN